MSSHPLYSGLNCLLFFISEQLKSFLQALTHPVHLTQGPPGTGKSYLGVVIVRALMIIRQFWMQECPQIGKVFITPQFDTTHSH
jgi:hypothetical protein